MSRVVAAHVAVSAPAGRTSPLERAALRGGSLPEMFSIEPAPSHGADFKPACPYHLRADGVGRTAAAACVVVPWVK